MRLLFRILISAVGLLAGPCVQAQLSSDGIRPVPAGTSLTGLMPKLYSLGSDSLLWLCDTCASKKAALLYTLEHAGDYGLSASDYYLDKKMCNASVGKPDTRHMADRHISAMAVAFCKDLFLGKDMGRWISYDGVSPLSDNTNVDFLIEGLATVKDSVEFAGFIASLEPQTIAYRALKDAFAVDTSDELCMKQLKSSLNYYRWIHHFHLDSFIVINIPSATLSYYKVDTVVLEMRAVVGTTNHHTPRFSAWCKEVTLYPYWNMPRSILVNEWLNNFRKNPALIDFLGMEIIDGQERVVPTSAINWKAVSASNFPYRIREKPGCLNPMGVLKFSLTSPYSVYMHDTNFKGAFLSNNRFYSHGCIRVEKPVALADALLENKVNENFLKACYKDQKPRVLPIKNAVPVFVVYMCAEVDGAGVLNYYNDVYGLLK